MALMRRLAVAVISTLLLVPTIQAEEATILAPGDMIALIGLDQNVMALRSQIKGSLRASGQIKDEAFLTYWESLSDTMFDAKDLIDQVAKGIEGRFTATEQASIRDFFTSELGLRMTEVENAAIVDSLAEREAEIAKGRDLVSEAGETRLALLAKMAAITGTETSKAASRQAFRALMLGVYVSQNRGGDIAIPWDEIDTQLDAIIPVIEKMAAEARVPISAYVYRDVSDEDLATYLAFFDSEVGRKFFAVVGEVLSVVEGHEVVRFGTALAAHSDTLSV